MTGASSGSGEVLAHRFARAGHLLVARRDAKPRALAKSFRDDYGARVGELAADPASRARRPPWP